MALNLLRKMSTSLAWRETTSFDGTGGDWLESIKQYFPKNLARILADRGLPKGQFAAALDVSASTVSHWLNGDTLPELWRLDDIARVLKTNFIELVRNPEIPLEHELSINFLREMARRLGLDLVKKN